LTSKTVSVPIFLSAGFRRFRGATARKRAVRIAATKDIEARKRVKAKERQQQHGGTAPGKKNTGGKLPQVSKGKTRDKVAAAVGKKERSLPKAAAVVADGDAVLCPSLLRQETCPVTLGAGHFLGAFANRARADSAPAFTSRASNPPLSALSAGSYLPRSITPTASMPGIAA